jgi:hypothetical protein
MRSGHLIVAGTRAAPTRLSQQLASVVLELNFCLLERAGTRATLDETAGWTTSERLGTALSGTLIYARSSSVAAEIFGEIRAAKLSLRRKATSSS